MTTTVLTTDNADAARADREVRTYKTGAVNAATNTRDDVVLIAEYNDRTKTYNAVLANHVVTQVIPGYDEYVSMSTDLPSQDAGEYSPAGLRAYFASTLAALPADTFATA